MLQSGSIVSRGIQSENFVEDVGDLVRRGNCCWTRSNVVSDGSCRRVLRVRRFLPRIHGTLHGSHDSHHGYHIPHREDGAHRSEQFRRRGDRIDRSFVAYCMFASKRKCADTHHRRLRRHMDAHSTRERSSLATWPVCLQSDRA